MKVLVTGGDGAMGRALRAFLPDATYLSHSQLDVTDADKVWRVIHEYDPNVVLHAAAITDHQCPDMGKLINTNIIGTQYVANAVKSHCKLIYLSTHYVYPGERGNYRETDEIRPIGSYAWTKWAGERIVASIPNHLIIRGSWYTDSKLDLWEKNGALADAWCSRLYVDEAAARIAKLVALGAWGTYNIGTSIKWTFANLVRLNSSKKFKERRRADLKLPYGFPKDSSVDVCKYEALVR